MYIYIYICWLFGSILCWQSDFPLLHKLCIGQIEVHSPKLTVCGRNPWAQHWTNESSIPVKPLPHQADVVWATPHLRWGAHNQTRQQKPFSKERKLARC